MVDAPLLALDSTTLLFVPPLSDVPGYVVQVTLRAPETTVETIAKFYMVQHEVSEVVGKVVANHLQIASLPSSIVLRGGVYVLEACHKPWAFGKRWTFRWGEERVAPAPEKWMFTFRLARVSSASIP